MVKKGKKHPSEPEGEAPTTLPSEASAPAAGQADLASGGAEAASEHRASIDGIDRATGAPSSSPPAESGLVPPTPRPASSEPRRLGPILVWAAILFLVFAVGGGTATAPIWLPYLKAALPGAEPDPFDAKRAAALAARVQALEDAVKARPSGPEISDLEGERSRLREQLQTVIARIESLEQSVGAVKRMAAATAGAKEAAKAQSSLDELSRRLGDLEKEGTALKDLTQRLRDLEKFEAGRTDATREGNRAIADAVDELTRRLGAIEKSGLQAARGADENRALVLAVAQLREATRGAAAFTRELEVVRSLTAGDPKMAKVLAELAPLATVGVPTLIVLRESFDATAAAIAHAGTRAEGWIERTVERISSLVTVRRTNGRAEAGSIDATLATAERALKEGDLIAAVDALSGLSGHTAAAAQPWLDQARSRIAVERALAALHVQAISRLAPAKG